MARTPMFSAFRHLAVLLATLLAGTTASAADTATMRDPYRINPGDVLQISVWKEEDLTRELLVNPDGHFAFPLAGDLVAEGKTVEQLRQELAEKLARFIPDVVVTVAALQLNGNKVYVLGQVTRPGEFVMTRNVDVMQAISTAGGTTPFAKLDEVRILRRGDQGTQIAIPFKYSDVQEGRKLEQNILLRAGDTIVVP
ncbi:MAG: polysaccharide biosynthesis/export family protein [Gammaproteobacteria bacterium]|nr:polysaccharide biosynthesis/export family protein [Gammaproteobacteria bacterium]